MKRIILTALLLTGITLYSQTQTVQPQPIYQYYPVTYTPAVTPTTSMYTLPVNTAIDFPSVTPQYPFPNYYYYPTYQVYPLYNYMPVIPTVVTFQTIIINVEQP